MQFPQISPYWLGCVHCNAKQTFNYSTSERTMLGFNSTICSQFEMLQLKWLKLGRKNFFARVCSADPIHFLLWCVFIKRLVHFTICNFLYSVNVAYIFMLILSLEHFLEWIQLALQMIFSAKHQKWMMLQTNLVVYFYLNFYLFFRFRALFIERKKTGNYFLSKYLTSNFTESSLCNEFMYVNMQEATIIEEMSSSTKWLLSK